MSNSRQNERLEELLFAAQAGHVTDLDELNQLLRDHPDLRTAAVESLLLDAMLIEEHQARETVLRLASETGVPVPALLVTEQTSWSHLIPGLSILALSASILMFVFWLNFAYESPVNVAENAADAKPDTASALPHTVSSNETLPIATVTLESDALWEPTKKLGDFVGPGDLTLLRGLGRLHTRRGTEMLLDARSGPVRLHLQDSGLVTVNEGIVVASVTEASLGFALRTPTTNVVDIGTSFAVNVNDAGKSEVQVLDGAVTCTPTGADRVSKGHMLSAGQATIFNGPKDMRGTPVVQSNESSNELKTLFEALGAEQNTGRLYRYEGFDYDVGLMNTKLDGLGWNGHWHPIDHPELKPNGVVREGQHLAAPPWLARGSETYCVVSLASVSVRKLAQPIDTSKDATVFLSFLMRKHRLGLKGAKACGAGLTLMRAAPAQIDQTGDVTPPRPIMFMSSIDLRDRLTSSTGSGRFNGGAFLEDDQTYFVVWKLDLRKDAPDNMYVKAFTTQDVPQVVEPKQWDSVGTPFDHNELIDAVHIWCNANAIAAFDEIRIGETWASVVPLRK